LVDLHEDVLKQHMKKGFAELGVDFTDGVSSPHTSASHLKDLGQGEGDGPGPRIQGSPVPSGPASAVSPATLPR
jgi:hypothetical protein